MHIFTDSYSYLLIQVILVGNRFFQVMRYNLLLVNIVDWNDIMGYDKTVIFKMSTRDSCFQPQEKHDCIHGDVYVVADAFWYILCLVWYFDLKKKTFEFIENPE